MSRTKLETSAGETCVEFECGLASDNVEDASKLIREGGAALRISIYPWGPEFDVVPNGAAPKRSGGEGKNGM